MSIINRKIHVVGINSFKFEDLPFKLQKLFIETDNIAVPSSYFSNIKLWAEENTKKKKNLFESNSNDKLFSSFH